MLRTCAYFHPHHYQTKRLTEKCGEKHTLSSSFEKQEKNQDIAIVKEAKNFHTEKTNVDKSRFFTITDIIEVLGKFGITYATDYTFLVFKEKFYAKIIKEGIQKDIANFNNNNTNDSSNNTNNNNNDSSNNTTNNNDNDLGKSNTNSNDSDDGSIYDPYDDMDNSDDSNTSIEDDYIYEDDNVETTNESIETYLKEIRNSIIKDFDKGTIKAIIVCVNTHFSVILNTGSIPNDVTTQLEKCKSLESNSTHYNIHNWVQTMMANGKNCFIPDVRKKTDCGPHVCNILIALLNNQGGGNSSSSSKVV